MNSENKEQVKIGLLGDNNGQPIYGLRLKNSDEETVLE
jgi:hypothetical protein